MGSAITHFSCKLVVLTKSSNNKLTRKEQKGILDSTSTKKVKKGIKKTEEVAYTRVTLLSAQLSSKMILDKNKFVA